MSSRPVWAAVLIGLLATSPISGAQVQQAIGAEQQAAGPSGWTFNIAPYLWLPTINTTLNYNLPPALGGRLPTELSVGPGEILSHLNIAVPLAVDAQYGLYSILSDLLYMSLSDTTAHFRSVDFTGQPSIPISRSAQFSTGTRLNATLWTLAGGYTVVQRDWDNFDVIVGFRYFGLSATTNYSLGLTLTGSRGNGATFGGVGGVSGGGDIWNGIAGFRGRIRLGNADLFIPYYFDIGTGGSKLTWQIASGLGYQTGWAGVSLTYRYLSLEQNSSTVVQHLSMRGPMIMVNFTF